MVILLVLVKLLLFRDLGRKTDLALADLDLAANADYLADFNELTSWGGCGGCFSIYFWLVLL